MCVGSGSTIETYLSKNSGGLSSQARRPIHWLPGERAAALWLLSAAATIDWCGWGGCAAKHSPARIHKGVERWRWRDRERSGMRLLVVFYCLGIVSNRAPWKRKNSRLARQSRKAKAIASVTRRRYTRKKGIYCITWFWLVGTWWWHAELDHLHVKRIPCSGEQLLKNGRYHCKTIMRNSLYFCNNTKHSRLII